MDIVTKEMLLQPGPGEYDSPKKFGDGAPSVSTILYLSIVLFNIIFLIN